MDEHQRRDVLGEHLMGELKAIREGTDRMPELFDRIGGLETRLERVEDKLDVMPGVLSVNKTGRIIMV